MSERYAIGLLRLACALWGLVPDNAYNGHGEISWRRPVARLCNGLAGRLYDAGAKRLGRGF